jgi:hypothetical protein
VNIVQASEDPNLFGRWLEGPSWAPWRTALRAIFGLPMNAYDLKLYRQCTGRRSGLTEPCSEAWLVCGRRSGKSFILALIAVYLACFKDWRPHLNAGERGTIMVIASDRKQSRVILRYIAGLLEVPLLAARVEGRRAEGFDLERRVTIEVHTASFRSVRGYSVIAALADELAFWRSDESANPDREVLEAIRPAMATIPGAMLLCASSPYSRRGVLWEAYQRHHGKPGPVLVWQAPTRVMNAAVPQRIIDEAHERDEAVAASEYGAQFRSDLEQLVPREVIEALVTPGVYERPPVANTSYFAFVDPSGGSADSMTLAIGHRQGDVAILDAIRERKPPFSPKAVVADFAALLRSYGCMTVVGDKYAGEWPRDEFRAHQVHYQVADRTKSELYRDVLPLLNGARVELLDHGKLVGQFATLERRTSRAGRDLIDHPPGCHDDVANAVAGALLLAQARRVLEGDIKDRIVCGQPLSAAAPGSPWSDQPRHENIADIVQDQEARRRAGGTVAPW